MPRAFSLVIALALVIAAGLVHGQWTQRWTPSSAVETAAARLGRVPMNIGDWRGRSLELNREQLAIAEVAGHVARCYENRPGRAAVTILLVCGRPGPIAVHTPDICYAGAGYEPLGLPVRQTLSVGPSGTPAAFRHAVFAKSNAAVPTYLRILWGWTADGTWDAPDNPRLVFAPHRALYKLYLIRTMDTAEEPIEDDPSLAFLETLLPELKRALFAGP
jgi:hypothetical protein